MTDDLKIKVNTFSTVWVPWLQVKSWRNWSKSTAMTATPTNQKVWFILYQCRQSVCMVYQENQYYHKKIWQKITSLFTHNLLKLWIFTYRQNTKQISGATWLRTVKVKLMAEPSQFATKNIIQLWWKCPVINQANHMYIKSYEHFHKQTLFGDGSLYKLGKLFSMKH